MRHLIAICVLTVFIIWDGLKNDGRYVALAVRTVREAFRSLGV